MEFQKGESGNLAGRPKGRRTQVKVPVNTQRALIKELADRALVARDPIAQELLAMLCLKESA